MSSLTQLRSSPGRLSPADLGRLQTEQHSHDLRNHFDILSRHKTDRLKHYGLHFAKYAGRLARESGETKPIERTLVDTLLVGLSAANTLHQDLKSEDFGSSTAKDQIDPLRSFTDAAGRFADACEKIDHLEEFASLARTANHDILRWIIDMSDERRFDLKPAVQKRRQELAARQFYVQD